MFTLVGYYDKTTHAALAEVDAIADPHMRVSVNDIYVPALNKIMAVIACGQNLTECRLQSPSLRRMANQRIAPVLASISPTNVNVNSWLHNFLKAPRTLDISEALNVFAINGGATDEFILVWLMDALEALPAGEIFTVQATASVTGLLGKWVNAAIGFAQTLPAGRYAIVGARAEDAKLLAARFVFPDISPRPGCFASLSTGIDDTHLFRYGELGNWGEFEHDAPPTVDFLAQTAGAITPEIILDLIQVRAGRS